MDTNALVQVAQTAAAAAANANDQAAFNTLIVSIIGFLGIVVTTIGTILLAKINKTNTGVKEQIDKIEETSSQIHGMVNKPFGVALETAAVAMETVAEMTGRDDHIQAASTARSVSNEHQSSMAAFEMAQRVAESMKAKVQVVSEPKAVIVEKGATVLVVDPLAPAPAKTAEPDKAKEN